MDYTTKIKSPVGLLTLASNGEVLTGLWLEGQKYFMAGVTESTPADLPVFEETAAWLQAYFAGENPGSAPALRPRGTPFQQRIWQALTEIPYGETTTYGALANRLNVHSARAVGSAVGRNPISILIPCHRVLGADGKLTGYAGGIERKKFLLNIEKTVLR